MVYPLKSQSMVRTGGTNIRYGSESIGDRFRFFRDSYENDSPIERKIHGIVSGFGCAPDAIVPQKKIGRARAHSAGKNHGFGGNGAGCGTTRAAESLSGRNRPTRCPVS